MSSSTYETLVQAGFVPVQELAARKILTTIEKGKRYALQISNSKESVLYQVDGNIITVGDKCDKLVLVKLSNQPEMWAEIFVELKGGDVGHALTQLIDTIKQPIFKHPTNVVKWARVVATAFPANKSNPDIERKKIALLQLGFDYKGLKTGQLDCI